MSGVIKLRLCLALLSCDTASALFCQQSQATLRLVNEQLQEWGSAWPFLLFWFVSVAGNAERKTKKRQNLAEFFPDFHLSFELSGK